MTDGVGELLEAKHWPTEDVLAVQFALHEALANAIRHGCHGDGSKHVQCSVSCYDPGDVIVVVQDPGHGFDPSAIADPLDATNILKPGGRGIFLINALMDEVKFAEGGREVQMRKRKTSDPFRYRSDLGCTVQMRNSQTCRCSAECCPSRG